MRNEQNMSPRHRLDLLLRLIEIYATTTVVERLHTPVEREIAASGRRIDKAKGSGNDEYYQAVVDEECEHIEELLGLAFVTAQTFIARLRSHVRSASKALKEEFGTGLSFVAEPDGILTRGPKLRDGHPVIEVINAVANYWKHEDAWQTGEEPKNGRSIPVWKPEQREKRTVELVTSIGMQRGSTGNLRQAARVLGVKDYADLSPIREGLKSWAGDLIHATRSEVADLLK